MKYFILCILLLQGCSTGKKGVFDGFFKAQVADEIKVADEVTGIEKADIKAADEIKIAAVDKSDTTKIESKANRDSITTITSDPKVLLGVSASIFTFMSAFMIQMFFALRTKDKQITSLVDGQQAFIKKQEEGQQKYIKMLEQRAGENSEKLDKILYHISKEA